MLRGPGGKHRFCLRGLLEAGGKAANFFDGDFFNVGPEDKRSVLRALVDEFHPHTRDRKVECGSSLQPMSKW